MSLAVGLLLFLALAALAYANGANDVSKGVATLVGSGTSRYRQALVWGTAWTAAGSLAAGIFSRALIDTFSKGIIGPHHQMSGTFLLAALIGAIIWVLLATWTGLPVSTTHAITGALCGAAVAAFGWRGVLWTSLEHKVVFPLLFSPLVSLAGLWLLFPALRAALGPLDSQCACAEARLPVRSALTGIAVGDAALPAVRVVIDHVDNCRARTTTIAGIDARARHHTPVHPGSAGHGFREPEDRAARHRNAGRKDHSNEHGRRTLCKPRHGFFGRLCLALGASRLDNTCVGRRYHGYRPPPK